MSNSINVNYISGPKLKIRPCRLDRDWTQAMGRFAYKCLPLTQANQLGWEILMNVDTVVEWNGGPGVHDVAVLNRCAENSFVSPHFGNATVTFNLPYLFTTPQNIDLWVRGPSNPDAAPCYALEGIVETWWNAFTFTMNWRFSRPNVQHVFAAGTPICRIVPIQHDLTDKLTLEYRNLVDDPVLHSRYQAWNTSRAMFSGWQSQEPHTRYGAYWQKHYYQGVDFSESTTPVAGHKVGWQLAAPAGEPADRYAVMTADGQLLTQVFNTLELADEKAKEIGGSVCHLSALGAARGGSGGCPSPPADMDHAS